MVKQYGSFKSSEHFQENLQTDKPKKQTKEWLAWALLACFGFTLCNTVLSHLGTNEGIAIIFYYAPGSLAGGILNHLF